MASTSWEGEDGGRRGGGDGASAAAAPAPAAAASMAPISMQDALSEVHNMVV